MRIHIPCTALGLALVAGAPAAHAQTVITRQIVTEPVETVVTREPVRTVETIRTVRVGPRHYVRHRAVTTTRRVIVRETIAAAPPVAVPASPPLYDEVVPATAPVAFPTAPPLYDTTAPPLYDDVTAAPAAVPAAPPLYDEVAAPGPVMAPDAGLEPIGATVPFYRYVYEPDRILVIDPATGIAVQSIPR